jgi:DNA-binding transcriptional regulator YiaG
MCYNIATSTYKEGRTMTFGEKVKVVRKKLFLSQEALANELGVDRSSVNRWEKGKFEPSYPAQKAFHEFCVKNKIVFKDEE